MLTVVAALVLASPRGGPDRLGRAPTDVEEGGRVSLYSENDAFSGGSNNDYTDGFGLEVQVTSKWLRGVLPDWGTGRSFIGVSVAETIYTPLDIKEDRSETLRGDRPYAGWLSIGPTVEWRFDQLPRWKNHPSGVRAELLMGPLGHASGAAAIQRGWHSFLRTMTGSDTPVRPAGWESNQVSGAFGANLFLSFDTELLQPEWLTVDTTRSKRTGSAFGIRLGTSLSLAGGNVLDQVGLAPILRIGLVSSTGRMAPTPPPDADPTRVEPRPTLPMELYAYARAEGRWVLYNAFLDRDTEYRGTEVTTHANYITRRAVVGEFELGALFRIGPAHLVYGWIMRSTEVSSPHLADRRHGFGRVDLAFSW